MPQPRIGPPFGALSSLGVRIFGLLALVPGVCCGLFQAVLASDPFTFNPVAELRQALKVPVFDTSEESQDLEYRRRCLQQCVGSLTRVADLRDALLLHNWHGEDSEERIAAIDRAARLEIARRFELGMQQLLLHDDPVRQMAAANMLGESAPAFRNAPIAGWSLQKFAIPLADLVHAKNPGVQAAAARALSQIQPPPELAVSAYGFLKKSADSTMRHVAAKSLNLWIKTSADLVRQSNANQLETTRSEILQMCRAAIPAACAGMEDSDAGIRRLSLEAIEQTALGLQKLIADPPKEILKVAEVEENYRKEVDNEYADLLPILRELKEKAGGINGSLTDPDPGVRLQAHRAIQEIGYIWQRLEARAAVLPVRQATGVSQFAARGTNGLMVTPAIRRKESPASQPLLYRLQATLPGLEAGLRDPDPRVRRTAVEALDTLGQDAEPVCSALGKSLEDPDIFVRWAAARTLGKIGPVAGAGVVPALAKLLRDSDLDVRLAAAEALRRFGPAAVEAVPNLMEILHGGDVTLQLAGLRALEGIGRAAQPAIPAVIKALQAPEPVVRKTAAMVLGKFGPSAREAGTALQMAMQDSDAEVRQAAGDALLAIGPQMEPHPHNGQKISSRPPPAPTASPGIWRQAAVPVRGDTIIPANYVPAVTPFPSAKPPVTLLAPIAGPSPTELAKAH